MSAAATEESPKSDGSVQVLNKEPESTTPVETQQEKLRIADRCDNCGAQAYYLVTSKDGLDLMFCGHHGSKYMAKLIADGFAIHDETWKLKPGRDKVYV